MLQFFRLIIILSQLFIVQNQTTIILRNVKYYVLHIRGGPAVRYLTEHMRCNIIMIYNVKVYLYIIRSRYLD